MIMFNSYTLPDEMESEEDWKENDNSQVEIRAVLIKCELEDKQTVSTDGDTIRFQREELFKHNALRECKNKLALAIKMSSNPDQTSVDEYIPIEHVLGANKKRLRLLNPYVLRLRRKQPFEAYKIRRVDTVSGILIDAIDKDSKERNITNKRKRNIQPEALWTSDFNLFSTNLNNIEPQEWPQSLKSLSRNKYEENKISPSNNVTQSFQARNKREMKVYSKYLTIPQQENLLLYRSLNQGEPDTTLNTESPQKKNKQLDRNMRESAIKDSFGPENVEERKILSKKIKSVGIMNSKVHKLKKASVEFENKKHTEMDNIVVQNSFNNEEEEFALYEIDNPNVWFSSQVQLFEKLNTADGKTMWNDLTKDDKASISSMSPEWSKQDINIRYRPTAWLPREYFTLPTKDLYLVVPFKKDDGNLLENDILSDLGGDFLIVPREDVVVIENDQRELNKRGDKYLNETEPSSEIRQPRSRVAIRIIRALTSSTLNDMTIVSQGSERYLKLPHQRRHQAQIDLEAVADDNELIIAGTIGRLTSIVSDTSRRTRSVLDVRATNTGLAAARYRVVVRECSPELTYIMSTGTMENVAAEPVILPPSRTHTFQLQIPLSGQVEEVHCTVALVNDDSESVAVRDVKVKRNDRCFCVWHCNCVCLGEDPKLLCQALTEPQLVAAGLLVHERTRRTRSVCYPDVVTINFFVTLIGVLLAFLFLGLVKACLGLVLKCIGSWGLHLVLQAPRKLECYYENSLRGRNVVYDDEGWPVHPDTKERNVRLVSKPMEYILNIIFFVILPCIMFWSLIKKITFRCQKEKGISKFGLKKKDTKKCFSSHDVQSDDSPRPQQWRRQKGLRKWMTPHSQTLTNKIWQDGLTVALQAAHPSDDMRPLLCEGNVCRKTNDLQSSCVDSEQDDTEYVLMKMQKSKESLAKCRQKSKNEELIISSKTENVNFNNKTK